MSFILKNEPATEVAINVDDEILISQPERECLNCGKSETAFVYFSPSRARLIAAEIIRLADELEGR